MITDAVADDSRDELWATQNWQRLENLMAKTRAAALAEIENDNNEDEEPTMLQGALANKADGWAKQIYRDGGLVHVGFAILLAFFLYIFYQMTLGGFKDEFVSMKSRLGGVVQQVDSMEGTQSERLDDVEEQLREMRLAMQRQGQQQQWQPQIQQQYRYPGFGDAPDKAGR